MALMAGILEQYSGTKIYVMKRILLIGMAVGVLAACNNAAEDNDADDTIYNNTETGIGTTDTGMMVDTAMHDSMHHMDSL